MYEALYCPEGGPVPQRRVAIKRACTRTWRPTPRSSTASAPRPSSAPASRTRNIVSVLDFGRVDDPYFFAMEHVDGMGPPPAPEALRRPAGMIDPRADIVALVAREVAEGLAFAHEVAVDAAGRPLRVVHRDMNPSNVLVSRNGQVKISDFGVARALGELRQVETRHVVGKMAYLAPEQARGDAVRRAPRGSLRARSRNLGAASASGPSSLRRRTEAETLLAVMDGGRRAPAVVAPPGARRRTLGRLLEGGAAPPGPDSRFQSAREMAQALAALLEHEGMPRPDELASFFGEVDAKAPSATSSGELFVDPSSRTGAATVKEIRRGGRE